MGENHRHHHRVGVALEMHVRGTDLRGHPLEEATSSDDVSRGGCSFSLSHEVAMGSELELEILRRPVPWADPIPFLTKGVVLRTFHVEPDQYNIGVRFTGPGFPTFSSENTTG